MLAGEFHFAQLIEQRGLGTLPQLAIRMFEQAVRIWPESSAANNPLGNVRLMTNRPQRAQQFYRLALRYDTQNAEALINLAGVLMMQGRYGKQRELPEGFIEVALLISTNKSNARSGSWGVSGRVPVEAPVDSHRDLFGGKHHHYDDDERHDPM